MFGSMTIFDSPEQKTDCLVIRVTRKQKQRITQLARQKTISAFVIALIAHENQRQIDEGLIDFFDIDEGIPF